MPSHRGILSQICLAVSQAHHNVRDTSTAGRIVTFLVEGSSLTSKKMQCPHGHSLLASALPSEAGLASLGQGAAPINWRWSTNRTRSSLTCLEGCCGGKRLKPDCAVVLKFLFLIKALYFTGDLFIFKISPRISFISFFKKKEIITQMSLFPVNIHVFQLLQTKHSPKRS